MSGLCCVGLGFVVLGWVGLLCCVVLCWVVLCWVGLCCVGNVFAFYDRLPIRSNNFASPSRIVSAHDIKAVHIRHNSSVFAL